MSRNSNDEWLYEAFKDFAKFAWALIKLLLIAGVALWMFVSRRLPVKPADLLEAHATTPSQSAIDPRKLLRFLPPTNTAFNLGLLLGGGFLFLVGRAAATNAYGPPSDGSVLLLLAGILVAVVGAYRLSGPIVPTPSSPSSTQTLPAATEPPCIFVYTITLPRHTTWESKRALACMEQLLRSFDSLFFQIAADHTQIAWQIVDANRSDPSLLESAIRASYPEAEVSRAELELTFADQPFFRATLLYGQVYPFFAPLLYVTDIKEHDPLASLTQAMNELRPGERIVYSLLVVGFAAEAYKEGQRLITESAIHPFQFFSSYGIGEAIGMKVSGHDRRDKYIPEEQRVFQDKLTARLYQAALLIQFDTPARERFESLTLVDSHLSGFISRDKFNGLAAIAETGGLHITEVTSSAQDADSMALSRFLAIARGAETIYVDKRTIPLRQATRLILDPRELASLWHFPHTGCQASRIQWVSAHVVALPDALVGQQEGISLGEGRTIGKPEPVYLKTADRSGHISIVGKTGVGKSTLLHHCIHQDIAQGRGIAVIDPHGSLVREILRWSIPEQREADVVLLDLADAEHPIPLNPLRTLTDTPRSRSQVSALLSILDRLYGFEHTRMRDTLAQAMQTVCLDEQPTLRDVVRVLDDKTYRHTLLERLENPAALDFWEDFERQSDAQRNQLTYPVVSRLRSFYGNEDLYPVLCHPDFLDFTTLLQQNKIVLLSLGVSEERIPLSEQYLVGSLVVSALQIAAMRCASERTAEPFVLYIDEVQYFVTSSLEKMLSEARKYGLSLTIANQFFSQLTGETLEAVMGNMATMVAFACGPDDANVLAKYMQPAFSAETLMDLDKYQAAVKLQCNGKTQPAFTLFTPKPLGIPEDLTTATARAAHIRQRSQAQYTPQSRSMVVAWLREKYPKVTRTSRRAKKAAPPSDEVYYDKP